MTQDEGIDIAVRLETAIKATQAALEIAEKINGAPKQTIYSALATLIGCRLACLEAAPHLKPLLL